MALLFHLLKDKCGSASVELMLAMPLLLILIVAPLEMGNYAMDEHALVKGVRDAAIYVAHQDISKFNCTTNTVDATVVATAKNIVRGGQTTTGNDRLNKWDSGGTTTVSLTCVTQASDGTVLTGIYTLNGGKVPIITVDATVPYLPVLVNLGFRPTSITLSASQQATVQGI